MKLQNFLPVGKAKATYNSVANRVPYSRRVQEPGDPQAIVSGPEISSFKQVGSVENQ